MAKKESFPFQVGQLAESRSFIEGYRSAWFRCEIKEVAVNKGETRCQVRYYDYEDDGTEWLDLYETPKTMRGAKKAKKELMLRPQFPPIYRESELPDLNFITDVSLVVDGGWSIGDTVDWREQGCYWCGTITEILGDDTVQLKLPDIPVGEGLTCVASCKDLRPSLNWSHDSGWTFPESRTGHPHARLILPQKQVSNSLDDAVVEGNPNTVATPRSLLDVKDSFSSYTSASSLPLLTKLMHSKCSPKQGKDISGKGRDQAHPRDSAPRKSSCSDSVSSSTFLNGASTDVPENISAKKVRMDEPIISLNSVYSDSDSVEAAVADLEELVCKVNWLKQILKQGIPSTSTDKKWEFVEYPTVFKPK